MSEGLSLLEAIVLGLIQGISEFLPISSTGHVTLAGRMFGALDPTRLHEWTAFLAVVQLGTLLAVLTYFWHDLIRLARGFFLGAATRARGRRLEGDDAVHERLAWLVVLGSIPIAIVGLAFRDVIEGPFTKNLWVIAASLVGFALLLALAEKVGRRGRSVATLGWRDALVIGGFQVMSLVPGASRAGTTLTGGLFSGLDREAAARFSFLLSVPAIGASGLLEIPVLMEATSISWGHMAVALVAAAVSGYASIDLLLRFLRSRSTWVFIWYRIGLGLVLLGLLAAGVLTAL